MSLFIQGNVALQDIERAMQGIGYRKDLDLLKREYEYTDVIGRLHEVRTINLAGFAQAPTSYRNVCIGVIVSNGLSGAEHVAQHRALGAPLIFEVNGTVVNRWKITSSGAPELKEQIPFENISNAFDYHRAEWEPERILRAKAIGEFESTIQLDFYDESLMPFLEGQTFSKLDHLLHEILTKSIRVYRQVHRREPRFQDLFPLAFRFIAAKVFRDRKYPGGWFSNDAVTALRAVESHYNTPSEELPPSSIHRREVLDEIWRIVLSTFYFPNLSEDDLALIFEKAFITPETRKKLGIHSTPLRVAEYIVHKLPFHKLPENDRYVLEPFSGHGRFLVSAMRRMRDLLSARMSDAERHNYFVRRLVGIEVDSFSVEVCRLSLMLADSPNPNGWRLYNEDVFATDRLQKELKRAQIVLCNPPFEDFTRKKREEYNDPNLHPRRPAELLRRVMSQPPELLGLVLPRIFESGSSYRRVHRQLAETYSNIELVSLPEVFNYSEAATTLIIASDRKREFTPVTVTCRKVGEGVEREVFLQLGIEPPGVRKVASAPEYLQPHFSLWVPPLSRVWDYLRDYPVLKTVADVHRGIKWKSRSETFRKKARNVISDTERDGYIKGYARVEEHFKQYWIRGPQYLSVRREDQYPIDKAFELPWDCPKVACNAARLQRSPWRLGAIADAEGMAFSQRFFGIWPRGKATIYSLAAIINSPLANAYLFAREEDRDHRVRILNSIPIPSVLHLGAGGNIDTLSRDLHRQLSRRQIDEEKAKKTLLQIDAEILRAYDLPPILERELLDTFQGIKRPVPFEFTGYYPKDFEAYIPLHELISPEFEEARADRLLERLVFVNDSEISEAMALLRGESLDEGLPS